MTINANKDARSGPFFGVAVTGLLLLLATLLFSSMASESPTTDEPFHLTRGLAYFWGPDTSLSYAHPPLGNLLAAWPVTWFEEPIAMAKLPGYGRGSVETVAAALFRTDYEARRRWFFIARSVIALLTLAMAAHLALTCTRLWGRGTALCALAFLTLYPTIVAHGRLVTTDMAVTVFMTMAVLELALYLRGATRARLLTTSLTVGAALCTKYTALVLVPLCGLALIAAALAQRGRYAQRTRFAALFRAMLASLAIGGVSLAMIHATYRFERSTSTVAELLAAPEPDNPITAPYRDKLLEKLTPLATLPKDLWVPLPYGYVFGLASIKAHAKHGHPSAFFGRFRVSGTPWYFPTLLLIKTPVSTLAALGIGLLLAARRRRLSLATVVCASFAAVMLLASLRASINIGVRHVLPVLPLLCVLAGRAAWLFLSSLEPVRAKQWMFAAAASGLLGTIWTFPDYLSDFNMLVLGRHFGQRISIVGEEWGQDMTRLGAALEARKVHSLRYNGDGLTTPLELARYDVSLTRLPCTRRVRPRGDVAVSARDIVRDQKHCFDWTRKVKPDFEIAGHVFVYLGQNKPAVASMEPPR